MQKFSLKDSLTQILETTCPKHDLSFLEICLIPSCIESGICLLCPACKDAHDPSHFKSTSPFSETFNAEKLLKQVAESQLYVHFLEDNQLPTLIATLTKNLIGMADKIISEFTQSISITLNKNPVILNETEITNKLRDKHTRLMGTGLEDWRFLKEYLSYYGSVKDRVKASETGKNAMIDFLKAANLQNPVFYENFRAKLDALLSSLVNDISNYQKVQNSSQNIQGYHQPFKNNDSFNLLENITEDFFNINGANASSNVNNNNKGISMNNHQLGKGNNQSNKLDSDFSQKQAKDQAKPPAKMNFLDLVDTKVLTDIKVVDSLETLQIAQNLNTTMLELSFYNRKMKNADLAPYIDILKEMNCIVYLDFNLQWNNINDLGLKNLLDALLSSMPYLRVLNLWLYKNDITDVGALHLANYMKEQSSLKEMILAVSNTRITEEGCSILMDGVKSMRNSSSVKINVYENRLKTGLKQKFLKEVKNVKPELKFELGMD